MDNRFRCRYCTAHFDNAKLLSNHPHKQCGPTMYQGQNGNRYNQPHICVDHAWAQSSKQQ